MQTRCYCGRPRRRHATVGVIAAFISFAAVSFTAIAQNGLGFLHDAPVGYFTAEDFSMMQVATSAVLSSTDRGATKSWQNPATGNSGSITLLASFTSTEGRDCKRLRVENHTPEISGSSTVKVCRFPDGGWLIDSNAKPKPLTPALAQ
jgi:surface antigen